MFFPFFALLVHELHFGLEAASQYLDPEDSRIVPPEEVAPKGLDLRRHGHVLERVSLVLFLLRGDPLDVSFDGVIDHLGRDDLDLLGALFRFREDLHVKADDRAQVWVALGDRERLGHLSL
jgi:hypothetical protein